MSFNSIGLVNYVESPTSLGLRLWDYSSTIDNVDAITTAGYFNDANAINSDGTLINQGKGLPLRVGDIIGVVATDASFIAYVKETETDIVVQVINQSTNQDNQDNI